MRYVPLLVSAAAAALLSGCAVYPAGPVAGPQPGVVYGTPVPVGVASAPYPYGYPYPYEYAYGGPAYYGPPVFFSGSFGYVHRVGPGFRSGFRQGFHGARPAVRPGGGGGGLHLVPRNLGR